MRCTILLYDYYHSCGVQPAYSVSLNSPWPSTTPFCHLKRAASLKKNQKKNPTLRLVIGLKKNFKKWNWHWHGAAKTAKVGCLPLSQRRPAENRAISARFRLALQPLYRSCACRLRRTSCVFVLFSVALPVPRHHKHTGQGALYGFHTAPELYAFTAVVGVQ